MVQCIFWEKIKNLNNLNFKNLNQKCTSIEQVSKSLDSELNKHKAEIEDLKKKLGDSLSQKELADKNNHLNQVKLLESIYLGTLANSELVVKESLRLYDDPVLFNCKSGAEYLLVQLQPFHDNYNRLLLSYHKYIENKNNLSEDLNENFSKLLKKLSLFSSLVSESVVSGKITSLTAGELDQADVLSDLSKNAGQVSLSILEKMRSFQDIKNSPETTNLDETITKMMKILNDLLPKVHDISKEEIGDLVEQEMHNTTEAIEAAVAKLEVK